MFENISIKREIEEELDDKTCHDINYQFLDFNESTLKLINQILSSDVLPTELPPKKLIKTETNIKCEPNFDTNINKKTHFESFDDKKCDKIQSDLKPDLTSVSPKFEHILQELFSWNPEWLRGRARTKPPVHKFEKAITENGFKCGYTRDEYISRHLPYIQSQLFIRLSDAYKTDSPLRPHQYIYIDEIQNCGELELNKLLVCYSLRDIRKNPKPLVRINDICNISLDVIQNNEFKERSHKLYFGLIVGQSMKHLNKLESNVFQKFETRVNSISKSYLLWDKLLILTKRSRESFIDCNRMSKLEVIANGSQELKQIQNLLYTEWKCTKLLSNIFNGTANIHQFMAEELVDIRGVRKTLAQNAIEMINKSNPMVFYKGVNSLMVVDITDETQRLKYLCDVVIEVIEYHKRNSGKMRFLVITANNEKTILYRERLRSLCGLRSPVKVWSIDGGRGWTRHEEVHKYTQNKAKYNIEVCDQKLKNWKKNKNQSKNELLENRDIFHQIINSYDKSVIFSDVVIAREEILNRGFEILLNECNVIIGTIDNIINCQPLVNDKSESFDCCVVEDSHIMPDPNLLSIIHLGVRSMIIGGDSESTVTLCHPFAVKHNFNISLFNRIFKRALNPL